jgi:hypothetical protein
MNNKLKAHLKTIGTILAIVGALVISLLLPTTVLLLTSTAIIYWALYDGFSEKN